MNVIGKGSFNDWRYEGTVWEMAGFAQRMRIGEELTFAIGTSDEVDIWGEWCGIQKVNLFDNDNDIYLVGFWGGEGNVRMYQMSEYDPAIGDIYRNLFEGSGKNLFPTDELKEQAVIARMIVKFAADFEGTWETFVWEIDGTIQGNRRVKEATADYTGGGTYVYMGQMYSGMYFMASDMCVGETGCITFYDADPREAGDDAFQCEWQEAHVVAEEPFRGNAEEEKEWWNEMISMIINSKADGNYLQDELEERLVK